MPVLSMFYGVVVRMFFFDTQQHNMPHIHVSYQGDHAVVAIPIGELLDGSLPKKKLRMVQVWIDLHEEELMANWELAVSGETVFKIDPIK